MLIDMVHLFVRIDFEPSSCAFGPGKAHLLERLSEYGTLRRAAASMGMSYRKTWLLVQEMEAQFNCAVVTAETGGTGGGGMHRTGLGTTLLKTYRQIEADATQASQLELQNLAGMVHTGGVFRRVAKRKRYPPPKLKNKRRPKKRRQ